MVLKLATRCTVTLSGDELQQAVRDYLEDNLAEAIPEADKLTIFVVTAGQARESDITLEIVWFEE